MKVNKTQAVLWMVTELFKTKRLRKEDVLSEIEIPNITFLRYIQEIRAFLCNFYPYYELIYVKSEDNYQLIGE